MLIKENHNKKNVLKIKFDVWKVHRESGKVDVLLPPNSISKYTQLFDDLGLKYEILESNIQK